MKSSRGRLRIMVLGTVLAMSSLVGARAARGEAEASVDAIWKAQRIDFEYRAGGAAYSCSGLKAKIERILVRVGAGEAIALSTYFCDDLTGIARLQIAFESPIEATVQNVQEANAYDSHDVLIARARGEALESTNSVQRLRAEWQTVSFARDRRMRLAPADCELVEQLRRQVLSRMSLRIVRDDVRCSPFGNITPPRLTVSALVATGT